MKVVRADEAAVAHVHKRALDGGNAAAARHREQPLVRCTPAAPGHGLGFVEGDKQQLVLVRHDHVAVEQVTELARLQRAGAHLGHRRGGEAFGQKRQDVLAGGRGCVFGGTAGDVGQAPGAGYQAHAHFHQTDVAFHVHHAAGRVHGQLATTAQRQATNGRDHGHVGVTDAQHGVLQLLLGTLNSADTGNHERGQHGLQVSTGAEGLVARPHHHGLVVLLGQINRHGQAFGHVGADSVHLGLDAGDHHFVVQGP